MNSAKFGFALKVGDIHPEIALRRRRVRQYEAENGYQRGHRNKFLMRVFIF